MKSIPLTALGVLFVLILTACGGAATEEPSLRETPATVLEPAMTSSPSTPEISIPESTLEEDANIVSREIAQKAITDLAGYLNMDRDQIRIADTQPVDWPDASLGCPQPEVMYVQVITPGYRILLEAKGGKYPYHTDTGSQVIRCFGFSPAHGTELPPLPLIPVNPTEIQDGQPWVPVN
ncbi:MAG: hypothetical protein FJZ87_00380 [Chloroflexi bacterium]|nr:hypothetical protein [Chloroflexota bacterium]